MDQRLSQVLELLDDTRGETVGTSMRLPTRLRDAASLAAEMGVAGSTTELTIQGLQDALESYVQRAVLDAHYEAHPDARPSLAEVAIAAAELDGNPLADREDLIRRAANEVVAIKPLADPDDVLMYAAGLAAASAA